MTCSYQTTDCYQCPAATHLFSTLVCKGVTVHVRFQVNYTKYINKVLFINSLALALKRFLYADMLLSFLTHVLFDVYMRELMFDVYILEPKAVWNF